MSEHLCAVCGKPIAVGQWPCVTTIRPHEAMLPYHPFEAYFDVALGRQIDSHADRWRAMKELQVEYRDAPSRGERNARLDRVHELKQREARGESA